MKKVGVAVAKVSMFNYFDLFEITPAFNIDLAALEAAYFKAQRQFHPDRFVGKTPEDKLAALQKSMDINQANETLKNPLKRAQYLLFLQGIIVGTDKDSVKPTTDLLAEIMELREELENGEKNIKKLANLIEKSYMKIENYYKNLKFPEMAQEVLRLGYLNRMTR
jgi:molecular chaperone HscB